MFKSYQMIGIHGDPNDLSFDYEIVDDDFIDNDFVAILGMGVGGTVEITTAVINTYEKRQLDVCRNLLVALRWHSELNCYELDHASFVKLCDYCPPYTKYMSPFSRLLGVETNVKCKLCNRNLLNKGFTQECPFDCKMQDGSIESHYTFTDKGKGREFSTRETFILYDGTLKCCNLIKPNGDKELHVYNRTTPGRSNNEQIYQISTWLPIEDYTTLSKSKFLEKLQTYQIFD